MLTYADVFCYTALTFVDLTGNLLYMSADVCGPKLTYADVYPRILAYDVTYVDVCCYRELAERLSGEHIAPLTYADVCCDVC